MMKKIFLLVLLIILILFLFFMLFSETKEKFENIQTLNQALEQFNSFKGNPFINDNGKILNQIAESKLKCRTNNGNGYYLFPSERFTDVEITDMINRKVDNITENFTISDEFVNMIRNLTQQREIS
jgi:hypothetical protein